MAKTKRYPGTLDRRGDTYRVRLCVAGKYHSFTVETRDKQVAASFAVQKHEELLNLVERKAEGLPDVLRVSELIEEFKSRALPKLATGAAEAYEDSLKPIRGYFVEQLGDPLVTKITKRHVAAFVDWRRTNRLQDERREKQDTRPLSWRTLEKDRAVLHRLFNFAEKNEYREGNPVRFTEKPEGDKHEPLILTEEQYEKLLEKCRETRRGDRLHAFVLLLGETGLREQEALHAQWQDVDFATGFVTVKSGRDGRRTKSGKTRYVPMTPRLKEALRDYFAANRLRALSPYVFHHTSNKRHHRAGERIRSLRHAVRNAAQRAKVPEGFRQHDLRHRRVTTWLAAGKAPQLVQQAMGHSDLKTTMDYTHLVPDHLRALVEDASATAARAAK